MKNILKIFAAFFIFTGSVYGQEEDAKAAALERTVSRLKTPYVKFFKKTGQGGITVNCTVMPQQQFIAVAWMIDNPNRIVLDISHENINLYDQIKNMDEMEPARVAEVLFGKRPGRTVEDYFINSLAPDAFVKPAMRRRTPAEEDLYASALNWTRTDEPHIKGIAYYDRYGLSEDISVEIVLNGESYKFRV